MVSDETEASIGEIKIDVKEIKEKLHSIDLTMAKNTQSLEEHMAQTMLLKEMVVPLHTERVGRIAVEVALDSKKNKLFSNLKIIGATLTAVATALTILHMLGKL